MSFSTRSVPTIQLLLCSGAAILMTLTGLLFSLGTHLHSVAARGEKFIGQADAVSVALIFGGIAVALKSMEIRLRAERDSSTD